MAGKVFSVTDFKAGLDVRKTPLTAPGGSLRILENAVLNQGGEVEKRQAFVHMTTIATAPLPVGLLSYMIGHAGQLHVFAEHHEGAIVVPGALPVPIVHHPLADPPGIYPIVEILDVEPFDDKFFVCVKTSDGATYCYYDGFLVTEGAGGAGGYSHGTYARTWKSKMYRIDGKYLRFSGINNPAQNDPASVTEPGAGFINMALNDPDGEVGLGMEVFYQSMAVMAELQTQIWTLDPDPTKDVLAQMLRMGLEAPHSVTQFGTGDVLFLSSSGVRSLKAQSSTFTIAASVGDVGSAIDLLLLPQIRSGSDDVHKAEAVVQPIQGRYWLAIGDTIYILSYFPAGDITAWSTMKPGFIVRNFAVANNTVYCLDMEGNITLYGGVSQNEYDNCKVTIRTPHMSADNPTENKRIKSVDVMCQGQWTIHIGMLPNNVEAFETCATIQDNTYGLKSIPFAGYGTHFGVHLEHQAPGPALLASLHFNLLEGATK
jgi:hypothetical protein